MREYLERVPDSWSGLRGGAPSNAAQGWNDHNTDGLDFFAEGMVLAVSGEGRTTGAGPAPPRDDIAQPPKHPLHHLADSPGLLSQLEVWAWQVFRMSLTLDRLSSRLQLRLGETSIPAPPVDAITLAYREAVVALPPLHEQGDGMRAFFSLLLPLMTGTHQIVLVDEPEAFLHPPQAAALGRIIGELATSTGVQVLLATHDRALLTGLLASGTELAVLRLSRDADAPHSVTLLEPARLRDLWEDPVTRYSNVLDGLFHHVVVLAEADADCRFYAAVLDTAATGAGQRPALAPTDVHFVPSGGKSGLLRLLRTLRAVAVPVVVTGDLDVLDDEQRVHDLVGLLAGDWDQLEHDYRLAVGPALRETDQKKRQTEWQKWKSSGVAVLGGDAGRLAALRRLFDQLDAIGLVLVREGELERLAPDLGAAKGPEWLPEALRKRAHEQPTAQTFIARVLVAASR